MKVVIFGHWVIYSSVRGLIQTVELAAMGEILTICVED